LEISEDFEDEELRAPVPKGEGTRVPSPESAPPRTFAAQHRIATRRPLAALAVSHVVLVVADSEHDISLISPPFPLVLLRTRGF